MKASLLVLLVATVAASEECLSTDGCVEPDSKASVLLQRQQHHGSVQFEESEGVRMSSFAELNAEYEASLVVARRIRERKALLVERDLSALDESVYRAWNDAELCEENGANAFAHFAKAVNLDSEITDLEIADFQDRVMEKIADFCKHDKLDTDVGGAHDRAEKFMQDLKRTLNMEKPLVTAGLVEQLVVGDYGFQAGLKDWMVNMSYSDMMNNRVGKKLEDGMQDAMLLQTEVLISNMRLRATPEAFDSRINWPKCKDVIGRIHNQGVCGSCWAFGSSSSIDSRLCISSDGAFSGPNAYISRGYVASCAKPNGCSGGLSSYTFKLIASQGVPTSPCSPYFGHGEGVNHFTEQSTAPPCPAQCDAGFARTLKQDSFTLEQLRSYTEPMAYGSSNPAAVYQLVREAIAAGGPIPAGIYADNGFMSYTSGVYNNGCNNNPNHETVAIGWGKDYWIGLNSWGPNWGEGGSFRVATCVFTDFTIPSLQLTGAGTGYPFPLVGSTLVSNVTTTTTTSTVYTGPASKKGCKCMMTWSMTGYAACTTGCCNVDKDAGGNWCFVEDQVCEGRNWGYCSLISAPATTSTTTAVVTTTKTSTTTSAKTSTTTTSTTTRTTTTLPKPWLPSSGACTVDANGCIMSPNYKRSSFNQYGVNQTCAFTVTGSYAIDVKDFNTEKTYDFLTVNGNKYSGGSGNSPVGVVPSGKITWLSDSSVTNFGWMLCPTVVPPPSAAGARVTKQGCKCKPGPWAITGYASKVIQGYCGNPDNDEGGDYCLVPKDQEKCQGGSNWGYCK